PLLSVMTLPRPLRSPLFPYTTLFRSVTESQGRIHTSAAGVLVMPEAAEVEITINPNDVKVDVFRSSGPGGRSVNTTDSAVRLTQDRKSTRLNSSHVSISYAVFCLKKK